MKPEKQTGPEIDLRRDQVVLNALTNIRRFSDLPFPTFADVQLIAASLRLLLIYDELAKVANSRRCKLLFEVNDAKQKQALATQGKVSFYMLGAPGLIAPKGAAPLPAAFGDFAVYTISEREVNALPDDNKRAMLPAAPFLKQSCLFQAGLFVTRQEIISYFANKHGGVHYDTEAGGGVSAEKLNLIEGLRSHIRLKLGGHEWTMRIPAPARLAQPLPVPEKQFEYTPDELDVVGAEFLGTARAVVQSPSVLELEASIVRDLQAALPESKWPEI
jgi:hypothetical protein